MKFTIKSTKVYAVYDGKYLQTNNGSVYRLLYNEKADYHVQKIENEEIIMSDLGFDYINSNLNSGWTLHDVNPKEK